jgi:hypothetical protein
MADTDAGESDTVVFQFEMGRDDWRQWTNTVPRDRPLSARIRTLIEQDARAARQAVDEPEAASVDLLASRIRIRTTQALSAVNESDTDAAADQLQEILDLADAMQS